MAIAPDGRSAQFEESEFAPFVRLVNDPFLGDREAVVAAAGTILTFQLELIEAPDGDDSFSAVLFDADTGAFAGELERFETTDSQSGTVGFDLSPYVGLTLGLELALTELDPFSGTLGSIATVSNLALETALAQSPDPLPPPVPLPGALPLLAAALAGLGGLRYRGRTRRVTGSAARE